MEENVEEELPKQKGKSTKKSAASRLNVAKARAKREEMLRMQKESEGDPEEEEELVLKIDKVKRKNIKGKRTTGGSGSDGGDDGFDIEEFPRRKEADNSTTELAKLQRKYDELSQLVLEKALREAEPKKKPKKKVVKERIIEKVVQEPAKPVNQLHLDKVNTLKDNIMKIRL
jgi:hypothetical protein